MKRNEAILSSFEAMIEDGKQKELAEWGEKLFEVLNEYVLQKPVPMYYPIVALKTILDQLCDSTLARTEEKLKGKRKERKVH